MPVPKPSFALRSATLRAMIASRRYVIEALLAAILMLCIELLVTFIEHPNLQVCRLISFSWGRRACIGVLMGGIIMALCTSPWGKRSGAHMNPAVTLTFWTLGRIKGFDGLMYVLMQFSGATLGVKLSAALTRDAVADPGIDYAVTSVGHQGVGWAFAAEFAMAFILMSVVLWTSARPRASRYTPALAGILIALFIAVEAPLSGMSINPVRTLSAGMFAGHLEHFWLYALAPTAGMLSAAFVFQPRRRRNLQN